MRGPATARGVGRGAATGRAMGGRGLLATPSGSGAPADPIAFTSLVRNASSADATSYVTTSTMQASADALVLAAISTVRSAGDIAVPTLSGGSMASWEVVHSELVRDDGIAERLTLFRAQQSSPGAAAALTVNSSDTSLHYGVNVVEFTHVAVGGNGADAIAQLDTQTYLPAEAGTSSSVTLAALSAPTNATAAFFLASFSGTPAPSGADWETVGAVLSIGSPNAKSLNVFSAGGDLTPTVTFASDWKGGIFAAELVNA